MTKNTGEGLRRGAVCDREPDVQPEDRAVGQAGRRRQFMDVKQDGTPFKGGAKRTRKGVF